MPLVNPTTCPMQPMHKKPESTLVPCVAAWKEPPSAFVGSGLKLNKDRPTNFVATFIDVSIEIQRAKVASEG
jgi:hypothetical protein